MLWVEFGDTDWWIRPIDSLPYVTTHTYASAGTYTVLAKGFLNCGGEVTTSLTVNSAAPAPSPIAAVVERPDDVCDIAPCACSTNARSRADWNRSSGRFSRQ